MTIRAVGMVVVVALMSAGPARTGAQQSEDEQSRQLFEQGRELADHDRWGEALEYFRRARSLVERPSIVFNIGVCLFTLGRHVEAVAAFDRFLEIADREGDADKIQRTNGMLRQSREAIATLELRVAPANATLAVDGRAVPGTGPLRTLVLDPGEHVVRFSAPGRHVGNLRLSVLPGQRVMRVVDLPEAPALRGAATPHRREESGSIFSKPIFWIVTGAVAVAGGVIAGVLLYDPGVQPPIQGTMGVQMTLTADP